jgi:hypothetical protein
MGSGVLGGDMFEGFTVAWWWGLREGGVMWVKWVYYDTC